MTYFLETARYLNFSRAAEKLYISQPTLSRSIVSLERELGVKLFERNTFQGTRLTLAGERMRIAFLKVQELLTDAQREAQGMELQADRELLLGLLEGQMMDEQLYSFLHDFQNACPNVTVEVVRASYHTLMDSLFSGEVDVILTLNLEIGTHDELEVVHFYDLDTPLVVPKSRAPTGDPDAFHSLVEFSEFPFICTDKNDSPAIISKLYEACAEAGFQPKIRVVRDLREQTALLEMGKGIAGLNPYHSIWHSPNVAMVHVREFVPQPFSFCYVKETEDPAIKLFHTFLRSWHKIAGSPG